MPASLGICRWRPSRRCRHPSSRLRSHLRPKLLPPQPFCHGRSTHGPLRFVAPQTLCVRWSAPDRRERSQDVFPTRRKGPLNLFVYRICFFGRLEYHQSRGLHVRLCCVCHGCRRIQGKVECCLAGGHFEHFQPDNQQLLDCEFASYSSYLCFLVLIKSIWVFTDWKCYSFTPNTPTETSPSTTSSRSCP